MRPISCVAAVALLCLTPLVAWAQDASWRGDRPGAHHEIEVGALPPPYATRSSSNGPSGAPPPPGVLPKVPPGFAVSRFATGLDGPREIRVAPDGDVFVSETGSGSILVLRSTPGAATAANAGVFASDLEGPFGIAFFPPGPDPRWVYVAETNSVVRFPYRSGDAAAAGKAETIVAQLAPSTGGHSTRDIRFSPDGTRMFVSVGSGSNVAQGMGRLSGPALQRFAATHPLGATWGDEARAGRRALVHARRAATAEDLRHGPCAIASAWRCSPRPTRCGAR